MTDFVSGAIIFFSIFAICYFVIINSVYLLLIMFSYIHIRKQLKQKKVMNLSGLFHSRLYKPVSVLAPAFNEENSVVSSVKSLLQLHFPDFQVIVINDGSTDKTMDRLVEHFGLEQVEQRFPEILKHQPIRGVYKSVVNPNLIVIDKVNGRKADALNAGINAADYDLVCSIDADSMLEANVLMEMLRAFMEDEAVIAVGGIVRVANGSTFKHGNIDQIGLPDSWVGRIQVVEYLRAFLFGRVGWDYLNSLLIISGAFGIFDRRAVLRVGGYLHDTVGEDMELVVRMHRYYREHKIPYRIRFLPEPVCWTEVPESLRILSRQRNRWQRGLADTLWRHKRMIFNPRYGALGMFAMPFFFFFEKLGPIVELIGYVSIIIALATGMVNYNFALIFLTAAVLLGMILSIASVICEELTFRKYPRIRHIITLSLYAFLENFGFRQMHTWWRFKGLLDFFRGNKEWGIMVKKGFGAK